MNGAAVMHEEAAERAVAHAVRAEAAGHHPRPANAPAGDSGGSWGRQLASVTPMPRTSDRQAWLSEDYFARRFVSEHGDEFRYVATWHQWLRYDGKRWRKDEITSVYAAIRHLVAESVRDTVDERSTANKAFIAGAEWMARCDPAIVVLPEQLDADPWALNTLSGIVDLRTGGIRPHDPSELITRLAPAKVDAAHGGALWDLFLHGITRGDRELAEYLQRVAGYCATGATNEDVLVYLFGTGANGKSSFAEAVQTALGDYATVFAPEVLMESKGERHPTELAQFRGVRMALSSEPSSSATWNDSRVKALTGDATINARYMRGDHFTFDRTHKTVILGNHMPRLNAVTHAIRRRVQVVPFRAVFGSGDPGVRERLKQEALPAILAWIVEGAAKWHAQGTRPPKSVRDQTDEYISEQDTVRQWIDERCELDDTAFALSSPLHADYVAWCSAQKIVPVSNRTLSEALCAEGFAKRPSRDGKRFCGLRLRQA